MKPLLVDRLLTTTTSSKSAAVYGRGGGSLQSVKLLGAFTRA
jgi:hypothetical protein